ncbi:hypothetical protein, partial [Staphylococcus aureus]|uniref:hypothetical protein n=1 Tax=Staphylococcus aureus TaxID=1280 RepID=UPI0038B30BD5
GKKKMFSSKNVKQLNEPTAKLFIRGYDKTEHFGNSQFADLRRSSRFPKVQTIPISLFKILFYEKVEFELFCFHFSIVKAQ